MSVIVSSAEKISSPDKSFFIDGVNVTRWDETSVVYKDKPTTEQNQYGYNAVIDPEGKVIEIIKGGDVKGENLAIPENGMVVSATGSKDKWLDENISLGDYVLYDSVSSRIVISKDKVFSPYYKESHVITGFNQPRYSNTFIIYDRAGQTTETNMYGYELIVNSEGVIMPTSGNNNLVPEGGYVVSATEAVDRAFLRMYGIPGARAEISKDKNTITITYDKQSLKKSIELKISLLKERFNSAKSQFFIIPYDEIKSKIDLFDAMKVDDMSIQQRNDLFAEIETCYYSISESVPVELRGIWHETVENNAEEVKNVVKTLKEAGINQLNLGISGSTDTIIPLPKDFAFTQKSSLRGTDLLKVYVDECKAAGIELIITLPIFYNRAGANTKYKQWLTKSNEVSGVTDESANFYSPASREYHDYILSFITYLLKNYEIDGLQLDYIRYPVALNGIDYGYDETTAQLFADKYNVDKSVVNEIKTQLQSHSRWNDWIKFKADLVTSYVRDIKDVCRSLRPDIYLSAAVANDTILSYYCQDIAEWSKQKLLDAVYPMSYGEGIVSAKLDEFTGLTGTDTYLFMGIGAYMTLSDSEIFRQVIDSRYRADGTAFFEYFAYVSHGYSEFLKTNAYRVGALSPTLNAKEAISAQISFMIERIEKVILPFDGISSEKATAVIEALKAASGSLNSSNIDALILSIEKEITGTPCEAAVKADLAKLKKLTILSKDTQKSEYKGVVKDESNTSSENSVVSETTSSNENENKPDSSDNVWLIIGVIITLIAAAAVVLILKNKKKKTDTN